jgi:nucleoid-associated protein YgaU
LSIKFNHFHHLNNLFQIMGLMSFFKGVGEKIFGKEQEAETPEKTADLKAGALLQHVKTLGLAYNKLIVKVAGQTVILEGEVNSQEDAEKIALAVGNVEGVEAVQNDITVVTPAPEAQYHTVEKGDWLSKIAEKYYGDPMKYQAIFEANKPMLSHPDKIYPGQVLRIPPLD